MQTVIEQHLQAPVGLFMVFLQTLKASIGLANFQVSMFCEFRLDLYKKSYFLCYVNIYIIHLLLFLLLLFHCCHCHFVLFLVFNISISSALCINS